MVKSIILTCIFVVLLANSLAFAAIDSTGSFVRLKKCYTLNSQRDISLIAKAKELIRIAKAYPKTDLSVRIYTLVGRGYSNARIVDSCDPFFSSALENLGPLVSVDAEAHLNLSIGFVELINHSYKAAEYNSDLAFKLYKKINNKLGMCWSKGLKANILMDQKKFKESVLCSEESGELALEMGDKVTYSYACITQGNVYGRIGENKLAVEKYQLAIPILKERKIYSELALVYSNMASCCLDIPDNQRAITSANLSISYSSLAGTRYFDGSNYLNLALANIKMGKIEAALEYADSARSISRSRLDVEMGPDKYKLLANVYNQAKVYDKALDCLISYDSLNIIQSDSIYNSLNNSENSIEGLIEKDMEIQNLKDLQKKQVQLQDAQRRILMLTVGVSVFLLLLVFLLFVFMNRSAKASKDLNEKNAIINHQFDELKRQNEIQLMTIGIVGHDLRGPLSTIVRLKQSMIDLGSKGRIKELEELLEAVFSNLEKILGLSNSLVDWVLSSQSGIQFKFTNVPLAPIGVLMEETFNLSLAEKNLTLSLDIADNAVAYADIECVKTICRNLIQNAIKFTPVNKQITFSAHLIKGISNNYVQVKIVDQGIGISPSVLQKIKAGKNTFSIGTKGEKGSGLGLIMVQALLSMNNGTLEISTEVGKGTTFELLIPAYISDNGKNTTKQRS